MTLIYDRNYHTPRGGEARIRIYTGGFGTGDLPVVICTERPGNPGMSITDAAAQLAAEVLLKKPDVFDPIRVGRYADQYNKPFIWIEHYTHGLLDPATFELVEFAHYEPRDVLRAGEWVKEIGAPTTREPSNRAEVEALVRRRV
jgi:hypothetical protein